MAYENIPSYSWKSPVETLADLPAQGNTGGDARVVKDADQIYVWDDNTQMWVAVGGSADAVLGPASSTDNAVARFDGTTGKLIKDSPVTISDAGDVDGVNDLHVAGDLTVDGIATLGIAGFSGTHLINGGILATMDDSDNFIIQQTNPGGTTLLELRDLSGVPGSLALFRIATAVGGGNPFVQYENIGAAVWSTGVDVSDSRFKIALGSGLGLDIISANNTGMIQLGNASSTQIHQLYGNLAVNISHNNGDFNVFGNSDDGDFGIRAVNNSADPNATSIFQAQTEASAKYQAIWFRQNSGHNWAVGQHSADSNKFKICAGFEFTDPEQFSITTAGSLQLGASGGTQEHILNTATATAGTDVLTLTNGPTGTVGNPDLYVRITINGASYAIPAWAL